MLSRKKRRRRRKNKYIIAFRRLPECPSWKITNQKEDKKKKKKNWTTNVRE
jgi:hypothetical protein